MSRKEIKGIEIIAPPKETYLSPQDVTAWVGLQLPLAPGSNTKHPLVYFVDAQTAVDLLAQKDPKVAAEAKRLYEERLNCALSSIWFSFERSVCKEVKINTNP